MEYLSIHLLVVKPQTTASLSGTIASSSVILPHKVRHKSRLLLISGNCHRCKSRVWLQWSFRPPTAAEIYVAGRDAVLRLTWLRPLRFSCLTAQFAIFLGPLNNSACWLSTAGRSRFVKSARAQRRLNGSRFGNFAPQLLRRSYDSSEVTLSSDSWITSAYCLKAGLHCGVGCAGSCCRWLDLILHIPQCSSKARQIAPSYTVSPLLV